MIKKERRYTAPKETAKNKMNKTRKSAIRKRIGIAMAAGLITLGGVKEYNEVKEAKKIESNAEINVLRSFKNIEQKKMGKYLKNEIKRLYEKYPDLDNMIFEDEEIENKDEFAKDIYRIYKALMVDKAEENVDDIEKVKVTAVDKLIISSDLIKDGDRKIKNTYNEKYKEITDAFIKADESNEKVKKLAKETYELLSDEFGLKENVLTSDEIKETIEKTGIYYDQKNNIVYTKEGIGHIEMDRKNEKAKEDKGFEPGD